MPSSSNGNEIERLVPRHKKIIELELEGTHSRDEISDIVGMTKSAVGLILNSPLAQAELARRRRELEKASTEALAVGVVKAKSLLEEASVQAAEVQIGLLASEKEHVKLQASNSILDRVMGNPSKEGNRTGLAGVVMLTGDAVRALEAIMKESETPTKAVNSTVVQGTPCLASVLGGGA